MLIFYFHVNGGTWKAVFFKSGFIKVCGSLVIASLISFESCPNVFCGASRKYNGWTFTSWMELRKIHHARFLKRWSSFYLDFPHGVNWWKERCLLPPGFFLDILQVCWEVSLPLWGLSQPLGRRGWLHCARAQGLLAICMTACRRPCTEGLGVSVSPPAVSPLSPGVCCLLCSALSLWAMLAFMGCRKNISPTDRWVNRESS